MSVLEFDKNQLGNLEYALRRDDLGHDFKAYLQDLLKG